jgi:DNA modification methylase
VPTIQIQVADRFERHFAAVRLMAYLVYPDSAELRSAAELVFATKLAAWYSDTFEKQHEAAKKRSVVRARARLGSEFHKRLADPSDWMRRRLFEKVLEPFGGALGGAVALADSPSAAWLEQEWTRRWVDICYTGQLVCLIGSMHAHHDRRSASLNKAIHVMCQTQGTIPMPGDLKRIGAHTAGESLWALIHPQDEPPAQIDKAAELQQKWRTATGQLWRIGEHQLLCGDARKEEDVIRLMGGERAVLFATDPPYAVGYTGLSHPQSWHNKGANKDWSDHYVEAGSADVKNAEEAGVELYRGFIRSALEHALARNAAWYCWHASKRHSMVERIWTEFGAFVHQQLIWVKSRPVLTYSTYLWQHEPCLFGWIKGEKPKVFRSQVGETSGEFPTTVWAVPSSEVETDAHPTSKPARLFALPMEMHTVPGDLCYEPFSGSGSQLVAAERTRRRCYAIEKSPAFVAVALERMAALGLKPEVIGES